MIVISKRGKMLCARGVLCPFRADYSAGNVTIAIRITGSFPSFPRCSRISLSTLAQAGTGGASSRRGLPWASVGARRSGRGDPLAAAKRLGDVDECEDPLAGAGVRVVHRRQRTVSTFSSISRACLLAWFVTMVRAWFVTMARRTMPATPGC